MTILPRRDVPVWSACTLGVVFLHGAPTTFYGKLVRQFAGSPTHCLLWFGQEGLMVESSAPDGVRIHVNGLPALERSIGDQPFTVATPPYPVSDAAVVELYHRAFSSRMMRYDWLGAFCYWAPITSRNRWTCAEFLADILQPWVPGIRAHSASPRALTLGLARACWRIEEYRG